MTEQTFKEGDVVRLKSGGPDMTYTGNDTLDRAICTWYDGKKMQTNVFDPVAIEKKPPARI